jgi:alkanesulfonate monooxygenase SsuD/methylene tetrahydromethanopterin reductase-like flavin-dependent oxidoreductase (luciferase family)
MTQVAARGADEVVLNLVTPEHVAAVRRRVDGEAAAAGRATPRLSVWVPAALEPGAEALAQLNGQLAIYLGAPGYGELFSDLGFDSLVSRARSGARRAELAAAIPPQLLDQIGAAGSPEDVSRRIASYHDAGADHVGLVPSTAEDPGGRRLMAAVALEPVA